APAPPLPDALPIFAMARGAPELRPCTDSDAHLSGVWDDARRSELRAAFAQSEATDALRHADQTIAALDGFARRWVDGHRDACEATSVRGEQSTEVLDLRTRCLWRRRQNLSALADLLTRADEVVVEHAIEAAADLPAPEACADLDFVSQRTEPPHDSATEARVEMVR